MSANEYADKVVAELIADIVRLDKAVDNSVFVVRTQRAKQCPKAVRECLSSADEVLGGKA
jgi:hypothetical protein